MLLSYAGSHGKQHALQEKLFEANFQDNKDINQDCVLRQLAKDTGLNVDEAMASLSDEKHLKEYEEGIMTAKRKGCHHDIVSTVQ